MSDEGHWLRDPPQNIPAEKAVLGAIFVNNRAYTAVSGFLLPEHFAVREHGAIFAACRKLIEDGAIADPVTLGAMFRDDKSLEPAGGASYLVDLAASAVTVINAESYARLIRECHDRRSLIAKAEDLIGRAMDMSDGKSADLLRSQHEEDIRSIGTALEAGPMAMPEIVDQAMHDVEAAMDDTKPKGISCGLIDVDRALGGFRGGELIVVAGATAMGKTAMAGKIAFSAARAGVVPLVFSPEVRARKLTFREMVARAGISVQSVRRGEADAAAILRIQDSAEDLRALEMWIDDRAAPSLGEIQATARNFHRRHRIGLVGVDYLQLVHAEGENRTQEVSTISRGLKALAMELDIPVVAMSQLSRAVDARDDKRPRLSDLRESGTIEQDADVVLFLYRPSYYLERSTPQRKETETQETYAKRLDAHDRAVSEAAGRAEIIVAKARDAEAPKTVIARFDGNLITFQNFIAI